MRYLYQLLLASLLLLLSGCVILTKKDGQNMLSGIKENSKNILNNSVNMESLAAIVTNGFKLDLKAGQQHQMSSFYRSMALQETLSRQSKKAQTELNRDIDISGLDLGALAGSATKLLGLVDPTSAAGGLGAMGLASLALNFLQRKKKQGLELESQAQKEEAEKLRQESLALQKERERIEQERLAAIRDIEEWRDTAEDLADLPPEEAQKHLKKAMRKRPLRPAVT
jgi:hypothetical protein